MVGMQLFVTERSYNLAVGDKEYHVATNPTHMTRNRLSEKIRPWVVT